MFNLAISCLTMSNLPWFMYITLQVPLRYSSLQHWTLLSSPDTSTIESHFHFGLVAKLLHSFQSYLQLPSTFSQQHTRQRSDLRGLIFLYLFAFLYCSWGSPGRNTGVDCHSLQWITFCQNSSLWPIYFGWSYTTWLIASLSYKSPFAKTRCDPWRAPRIQRSIKNERQTFR